MRYNDINFFLHRRLDVLLLKLQRWLVVPLFEDRKLILWRDPKTCWASVYKSRHCVFISSIYLRMKTFGRYVIPARISSYNIRCTLLLKNYLSLGIQIWLKVLYFIWQPNLCSNEELLQTHIKIFDQSPIPLSDYGIDQILYFYTRYEFGNVMTVR